MPVCHLTWWTGRRMERANKEKLVAILSPHGSLVRNNITSLLFLAFSVHSYINDIADDLQTFFFFTLIIFQQSGSKWPYDLSCRQAMLPPPPSPGRFRTVDWFICWLDLPRSRTFALSSWLLHTKKILPSNTTGMSSDDDEWTAEIPIYGQITIESRLSCAPSCRHLTVYTTGVIEDTYNF